MKEETALDGIQNWKQKVTRRNFLKAAASTGIASAAVLGGYYGTRDCIRVGIVGLGVRGGALADIIRKAGYYQHRYGRVVAIADVNGPRAKEFRLKYAPAADIHSDHRTLVERQDVDAVIVSCCDHWHAAVAIDAMLAGKAVYLEKPMSNTVQESFEIVRVAKELKARILVGTQQRNDAHFRTAAELVTNGRLGKISDVAITVCQPKLAKGPFAESPIPDGLDWDRFLGPAPMNAYAKERYLGWHYFWDYGGGELTNWGIHHFDCALWSLALDNHLPSSVTGTSNDEGSINVGFECPQAFGYEFEYPGGLKISIHSSTKQGREASGVKFRGENGEIFVSRTEISGQAVRDLATTPLPVDAKRMHANKATWSLTSLNHLNHFFNVARGEATPVSSIESSHYANVSLHAANISLRTGRQLVFGAKDLGLSDEGEHRMADPPRRTGYELNS